MCCMKILQLRSVVTKIISIHPPVATGIFIAIWSEVTNTRDLDTLTVQLLQCLTYLLHSYPLSLSFYTSTLNSPRFLYLPMCLFNQRSQVQVPAEE